MPKNRKAMEKFILDQLDELIPESKTAEIYRQQFAAMSDAQFDAFAKGLADGSEQLTVIVPNLTDQKLSVERNFALAKKLGHNFFERIWITPPDGGARYLTPIPYMIIDLPLRRQAQLLVKKIAIPDDNKSIDDFTGQPTGGSKGSTVSYPESQVLAALGLDKNIEELIHWRGGDLRGFNAMNATISKAGAVSLDAIKHMSSQVRSTQTLRVFLTSMHLQTEGLN